ncbi:MAG TPA: FtsX-like permease family protein, partial [Chryseolinea sp.]
KQLFSDAPFDYFFLDSYFDTFYKEEQHFAGVFGFFSVIGILITCMGLFGLSLYDTTSRAKEIGIRKTLGAPVKSIMWLFSKDYMKLVLSAAVVGIPAGYFLLNEWLKNYPSRINLDITDALWPLLIMFFIAIATVGYHTFKTANLDPVVSLRNE